MRRSAPYSPVPGIGAAARRRRPEVGSGVRVSRRPEGALGALGLAVLLVTACGAPPEGPGGTAGAKRPAGPVKLLETPAPSGALAPELSLVRGDPFLSWIETGGGGRREVRFTRLRTPPTAGPGGVLQPVETVTISPGGDPDDGGSELFANWADRPGAVQGGDGPGGPAYAWWLAKNGSGPYAYAVHVVRSADGGSSWEPLGLLHDDDSPTEHGFVTMIPEGPGVRAFWLDGRATARGEPMALRTVRITDRIERETEEVLDTSVCDCCNTAALATDSGPLVVYRDRTAGEVRDHSAVRRTADGWSDPYPVHRDGWEIAACPVNGPAVGRSGNTLWVAWFTAAPVEGRPAPRVLAAASTDGGRTFGEPVLVDGDGPMGRLDLAVDGTGRAIVSWLGRTGEGEAVIRLRRLVHGRGAGAPLEVARAAGSRASGVPRLLAWGDRLLVAWVEPEEDSPAGAIRLASLPASAVPAP